MMTDQEYIQLERDMFDLGNSLYPMREFIIPHMPEIEEAANPLFQPLAAILDAEDPKIYLEIIEQFEFGTMPIALAFVLAFVLNVEPVLGLWNNIPGMEHTAETVFNNAIVKNRIFDNIAEALPIVIDKSPRSLEIIRLLQNFGLSADEWYYEVGSLNLNGVPIDPGVIDMLATIGYI